MMPTYKHILVPLDGSKLAERALETAVALAKQSIAKLTLLRIVTPLPITIQPSAHHHLTEAAEYDAADYLHHVVDKLANNTTLPHARLLRGDAANSIVYFAKKHGVDLIVMSSHGRSGLSRLFLGSVAEEVLRKTPCPVLLVRADDEEAVLYQKVPLPIMEKTAVPPQELTKNLQQPRANTNPIPESVQ